MQGTSGSTLPAAPLPLSYGVPEIGKSGFIDTLQPQATPVAARQEEREELGDFVSFDDLPPQRNHVSAAVATGTPAAGKATSTAWCESRRFWPEDAAASSSSAGLSLLHEELLDFWQAFQPTRAEREAREELVRRVTAVVQSVTPSACVQAFGSYETGLYLPESDIDLVCLDTGLFGRSKRDVAKWLHELAAALRKAEWPVAELEVVDKARVPIIKFVDGLSGVSVDVCVEETSGLQSSKLARKASKQFPGFGVLVLFLKRFLNTRGLHETFSGGVGSFLLQLLVICTLQHPPSEAVRRHHGAAPRGSLAVGLLHFFEVFGLRLNYEAVVVSVREGGRFLSKHSRGKGWCPRDRMHFLSVENPLDTSHDVAANSYNIASVRRVWGHAYFALLSTLGAGDRRGQGEGGTPAWPEAWLADEGSSSSSSPKLRVLSGLVRGLESEMAERFAVHARERGAGTTGGAARAGAGAAAALAVASGAPMSTGKRKRDAVEEEEEEEEEGEDQEEEEEDDDDEGANFVADDGTSDGSDAGRGGEDAGGGIDSLFSLRAAHKAFPGKGGGGGGGKKRRRGDFEDGSENDGARSEQPRGKGGAAGRRQPDDPHPREFTKKARRLAKIAAKDEKMRQKKQQNKQNHKQAKKARQAERRELSQMSREGAGGGGSSRKPKKGGGSGGGAALSAVMSAGKAPGFKRQKSK